MLHSRTSIQREVLRTESAEASLSSIKVQSSAPEAEQPHNWYRLGTNWLSCNPAEIYMELGWTLNEVNSMRSLQRRQSTHCNIRRRASSRSQEKVIPLSLAYGEATPGHLSTFLVPSIHEGY